MCEKVRTPYENLYVFFKHIWTWIFNINVNNADGSTELRKTFLQLFLTSSSFPSMLNEARTLFKPARRVHEVITGQSVLTLEFLFISFVS